MQPRMTTSACAASQQNQTRAEKIAQFRRTWGNDPDLELFVSDNIDQFGNEWPDRYHCDLDITEDFLLYMDAMYI